MVGVLFDIDPGWHLYWKNPGAVGLPTKIKWELPAGFTVGDLVWPVPEPFTASDNAEMYGYQGKVLLSAKVIPPPSYHTGDELPVIARVSWLACSHQSCIKDNADIEELLKPAQSQAMALFTEWMTKAPKTDIAESALKGIELVGGTYRIQWSSPVSEAQFLPADALLGRQWNLQMAVESPLVSVLSATRKDTKKEPGTLKGLLRYRRAETGLVEGVELSLPPGI
jgi:thiol:disulfide interchange protein DsbD